MIEYQRVIAEIDLDAVAYNMKNIRALTPPNVKIMGIVKADAYGHGAVEVSKVLLYHGADCLGVAMLDEGIQLRKNNIFVPILSLGYTPSLKLEDAVKYDITQTVFSYDMAAELSQAAVRLGKKAKVHIKIDTGMGRIGFSHTLQDIEEILKIGQLKNIECEGIYTHFSTADEEDKSFTNLQRARFCQVLSALEQRGMTVPVVHAANSGAIMDFDNLFFNMVRAGIIQYGLYPSSQVDKAKLDLKPAMSLKTHISFVKDVEAGEPIGYGRKFITNKKSRIATIPVGYADGFLRAMSKGGRVLVNGAYAPVVGNICMDQFMVDITGIDAVKIGDEVVLLGRQGTKEITADEIAEVMDTINYEVVCLIGKRVPREYIKNNAVLRTINYI